MREIIESYLSPCILCVYREESVSAYCHMEFRSSVVRLRKKRFMKERPTIETTRLILRPFTLADTPEVQRLAGDRDVASTTLHVPHPYEDGMAE